ncbi:hypothetical protein EJ08DRAFT_653318 [Tothia fuscella]|uniref:Uncharacterized protein n=1 Tax=Tothia fuscella TaxID=1048955 RepID=A0A9P4NHL0_9PEZI|nr:hypothetical protein EJ08DRAFT_653318 [Tothia fuscella]
MDSLTNYFVRFKHNGFYYNSQDTFDNQFSLLTLRMDWGPKAADRQRAQALRALAEDRKAQSTNPENSDNSTVLATSPYFLRFKSNGFTVNPGANFEHEFSRLAKRMRWGFKAAERHRANALKEIPHVAGWEDSYDNASDASSNDSDYSILTPTSENDNDGWEYDSDLEADFRQLSFRNGVRINAIPPQRRERDLEEEMNSRYGSASKLEGWQKLCADVAISPVPASITQCKKALTTVYVNIFDLIEARNSNSCPPQLFRSLNALRNYSRKNHKVYSRINAKEDGFTRALLRRFIH